MAVEYEFQIDFSQAVFLHSIGCQWWMSFGIVLCK